VQIIHPLQMTAVHQNVPQKHNYIKVLFIRKEHAGNVVISIIHVNKT
jgi:hypothetical protein